MDKLPKHRPINQICLTPGIWIGGLTVFTFFLTLIFAFLQEKKLILQQEKKRLSQIAPAISRALSGELLVNDQRAIQSLIYHLKQEYSLSRLEIDYQALECKHSEELALLKIFRTSTACWSVKIEDIQPHYYLYIENSLKDAGFLSTFNFLLLGTIPLLLFGILSISMIRRSLNRSVVQPIEGLEQDPQGWRPNQWTAQEVVSLVQQLRRFIQEREHERRESEKLRLEASLGSVAHQVAHDVRSPLAALELALSNLSEIPEERRTLVRKALSRIRDIANDLNQRAKKRTLSRHFPGTLNHTSPTTNKGTLVQLLSPLVESLVSEKRTQYRNNKHVHIETRLTQLSYGLFAEVNPISFDRVLSNLIDNSVEALPNRKGIVQIQFHGTQEEILLEIIDNGKGIPPEVLPKLMQKGQTHGKTKGSGLGLYHAREHIENWGGSIEIRSKQGKGTTVEVRLPRATPPSWFVPRLRVQPYSTIFTIDDEDTIHHTWEERFRNLNLHTRNVTLHNFSSPEKFREHIEKPNTFGKNDLFLVDYEYMGSSVNGIELIQQMGIKKHAILVTSRFDERNIIRECENLSLRLIPKSMAPYIPIEVSMVSQ